MLPSRTKSVRRWVWLPVAVVLAAAPKCLLCLAAYAGVGALLGLKLAGPEICGATASPLSGPIIWISVVASIGGAMLAVHASHRRRRTSPHYGPRVME